MSDAPILILSAAAEPDRTAAAIAKLQRIEITRSEKVAVVHSKIDLPSGMQSFNAQAGYPSFPERMATLSGWSGRSRDDDATWIEGCALWALRQALAKRATSRLALLILDDAEDVSQCQPVLDRAAIDGIASSSGIIGLDCSYERMADALALAEQSYASGAAWNDIGDLADIIGAALSAMRKCRD